METKDNAMEKKRTDIRIPKNIPATVEGQPSIVENISKHGGFIKINRDALKEQFNIVLQLNKYKSIEIKGQPQWSNEHGVGFKVLQMDEQKKEIFESYLNRQIEMVNQFGTNRIFRTEIVITLGETNATGNVYFSNYFDFQGIVRERCLLAHIPNANKYFMETGYRLVTIDAYNKFINNAYFGDTIIAELTTESMLASQIKVNIRFKNKDTGALIGDGYQNFCCVNAAGRVVKIPKAFEFLDFYLEG
jgi:enediyne core biosynthesis thioesterase